jgi:hypothetical protein
MPKSLSVFKSSTKSFPLNNKLISFVYLGGTIDFATYSLISPILVEEGMLNSTFFGPYELPI